MRKILSKSQNSKPLVSLVILIILFTSIGILSVFFRRGFDLTDESFYLLHSLHWQSLHGIVSFFGAFLSPLLFIVNGNVWGFRLMGLVLLLVSGFYLGICVTRLHLENHTRMCIGGILSCVSVSFYGDSTLYTPSYNLLTLVFCAFATAFFIRLTQFHLVGSSAWVVKAGYALTIGALFWNKFSVVPVLLAAQVVWILCLRNSKGVKFIFQIALLALGGLLFITFVLFISRKGLFVEVQHGFEYLAFLLPMNIVSQTVHFLFTETPTVLFINKISFLVFVLTLSFLFLLVRGDRRRKESSVRIRYIPVYLSSFMGVLLFVNPLVRWVGIFFYGSMALWFIHVSMSAHKYWDREPIQQLLIILNLSGLPLTCAFGTNSGVVASTPLYVLFPATAFVYSFSLYTKLLEKNVAPILGLCVIAALPIGFIVQPWYDKSTTYRLNTSLAEQTTPVKIGSGTLLVDREAADSYSSFRSVLDRSGFKAGTPIIDLTGGACGLVFLANGRSLPLAWILGGYPGSTPAAELALNWLSLEEKQRAWLLVSRNSPRRIASEQFGPANAEWLKHYVKEGEFKLKIQNDDNLKIVVEILRPKVS
jgi:hypothetical protein